MMNLSDSQCILPKLWFCNVLVSASNWIVDMERKGQTIMGKIRN